MGVGARARTPAASRCRATRATTSGATPTTSTLAAPISASAPTGFSIEWSRIEPEDGEFSARRARPLPPGDRRVPRARASLPVVTFHHFTTPRWAAADARRLGPSAGDRRPSASRRFCERAVAHLGDLIGMACTINEPNIVSLMGYLDGRVPARAGPGPRRATRRRTSTCAAAHRAGYDGSSRRVPATSRSG